MKSKILYYLILMAITYSCNSKRTYEARVNNTGNVFKAKGSDTEFELVKQLFRRYNEINPVSYQIEGGGTELGFRALINGEADMTTASREISEKESRLLEKQNISVLPVMFAIDALAIITHPHLGVDSLSMEQLSGIYRGEINNWKEVGGPDRKITLYTRNMYSGTHAYFIQKVLHKEICSSALVCATSSDITNSVSKDSSGIGYVGSGFLMDRNGRPSHNVWAMPLYLDPRHPAFSPYQTEEVKNGNYPLTRPLYQYYRLPINNKMKDFILFELGGIGQNLIRRFGYFPLNDYQKEINRINGYNL